jgi:hypothetical protein
MHAARSGRRWLCTPGPATRPLTFDHWRPSPEVTRIGASGVYASCVQAEHACASYMETGILKLHRRAVTPVREAA